MLYNVYKLAKLSAFCKLCALATKKVVYKNSFLTQNYNN